MIAPILAVTIPGEPVPKGRPRFAKGTGNVYTPAATKKAEELVAWSVKIAWRREPMQDGAFGVHMTFYRGTKRPVDLDNLIKLVWDSCNDVLFRDDSQVCSVNAIKSMDRENPRTVLRVYRFEDLAHEVDV
jgi:crossover junction endodeoxyribonuclease RusA